MQIRTTPALPMGTKTGAEHALDMGQGVKNGLQKEVSLGSVDRADLDQSNPRKLLNDQIISALEQALGKKAGAFYELKPEDFSPQKVAHRILNFVGQALAQLEGDSQGQIERLQAARQGVKIGFNEAKEILTGLGAYVGEVQENAEQTYDLVQQGLDDFDLRITNGQPIFQEQQTDQIAALTSASYSQSQQISLQVTTRDGDMVTLHIDKNQSASESIFLQGDGDNNLMVHNQSSAATTGLSYRVEGHINDQELAAIDALVGEIQKVSNDFFSGDTQAAMETAGKLGYDIGQIASYSLSLSESTQSRATSVYQSIDQLGNGAKQQLAKTASPIGKFVREFAQALDNAEKSPLFGANADDQFQTLFANLPRLNEQHARLIDELQQRAGKSMELLTAELIQAAKPFIDASNAKQTHA